MLRPKQRQYLRALAHDLAPVVQIGKNGLSETTYAEVSEQLRAHELIKVRILRECPLDPAAAAEPLAEKTGGEVVQKLGRVLTVYRRHDNKPKIEFPR
jgi:RNA-binding protein